MIRHLLVIVSIFLTAALVAQQPAYRANDFSDFVGISGAPIKTDIHVGGAHDGAGKTFEPQVFHDLGVRNYRIPLKYALTLPDQPQQVEKVYRETGARAMVLIDHNKFGQNQNLKYKDHTDEAAASLFMADVYKSLKADPATKDIPVIAYTSIFSDYREAGPHNSFDFGNIHSYQNYGVPSSSLLMNFTRFNNIYPDGATIKPFVPTECGYNVEADKANGTFTTGSLRAQALNIPILLTEYFNHGIRHAYLFAIHNADGYGLLESDLKTKRPDFIVTSLEAPVVVDGKYKIKGTFKNIGDGASPIGVSCTMVFSIDGKTVATAARTSNPSPLAKPSQSKKPWGKPNPAPTSSARSWMTSTASAERKTKPTTRPTAPSSLARLRKAPWTHPENPHPTSWISPRKALSIGSHGARMESEAPTGKKDGPHLFSEMGSTGKGYMDATLYE